MRKSDSLKAAWRVVDAAALLSIARRIGLRRSARILAFATSTYLDRHAHPHTRRRKTAR